MQIIINLLHQQLEHIYLRVLAVRMLPHIYMIAIEKTLPMITIRVWDITFIFHMTLDANRTYYIKIFHENSNSTGSYGVKVYSASDDHGNDISHTTQVMVGSETSGEINYSKDVDIFKFIPLTSGRYTIETTGTTDTFGDLYYDYYGSENSLTSNDNVSSTNKNFSITTELSANQIYYIKVYHHNHSDIDTSGIGAYKLKVFNSSLL